MGQPSRKNWIVFFLTSYTVLMIPTGKWTFLTRSLKSCLDKHAPLRRTKITRPPAPWLNKGRISKLLKERNVRRYLGHKTGLASVWINCVRLATRSRLRSSHLNVLFSGVPYHLITQRAVEYHTSYFTSLQSPANQDGPWRPEQALLIHITPLTGIREFLIDLINSLPEEHLTCSCV